MPTFMDVTRWRAGSPPPMSGNLMRPTWRLKISTAVQHETLLGQRELGASVCLVEAPDADTAVRVHREATVLSRTRSTR
jgi:hypothetical protein